MVSYLALISVSQWRSMPFNIQSFPAIWEPVSDREWFVQRCRLATTFFVFFTLCLQVCWEYEFCHPIPPCGSHEQEQRWTRFLRLTVEATTKSSNLTYGKAHWLPLSACHEAEQEFLDQFLSQKKHPNQANWASAYIDTFWLIWTPYLSFSPPSPPISFSALTSFLAHRSTCCSSCSFLSVISLKDCLRLARRSSTARSSDLLAVGKTPN